MFKNKTIKMVTIFILVFILLSILYVNISIGAETPDTNPGSPFTKPDDWDPSKIEGYDKDDKFIQKAANVYSIISVVGIVVSALALAGIGIKYMLGSVEEKAEYKKSMIPYIIGILLLGVATILPTIINTLTQSAFTFKGIV